MLPENILVFFAKFIESELGIVYAKHNYFQLENRLEEIAKFLGIESVDSLYQLAQKGIMGQFKNLLLDVATNNETSFFRDMKIFTAIEKLILPSYLARPQPTRNLSFWSAASSTGQEALSICMLLKEWNRKNQNKIDFEISGTDVSERVLARAKSATYTQLEVQRGLPMPLLVKYFSKNNQDQWIASSELTNHINFKKMNLKDLFPFPKPFDVILCRNVLIYQSVESKTEILKRITAALSPDGYLILGAGESLLGLSDAYGQSEFEGAVVYQKRKGIKIAA